MPRIIALSVTAGLLRFGLYKNQLPSGSNQHAITQPTTSTAEANKLSVQPFKEYQKNLQDFVHSSSEVRHLLGDGFNRYKSSFKNGSVNRSKPAPPGELFNKHGVPILQNPASTNKYSLINENGISDDIMKDIDVGDWGFNNTSLTPTCHDVLGDMIHGVWRPKRNISEADVTAVEEYQEQYRSFVDIGRIQRRDGNCGRGWTAESNDNFMALCDPKGQTPCCFEGRCSAMSVDNCTCKSGSKNCFDLRHEVMAEISDWHPLDESCRVKIFSQHEACSLLRANNVNLVIVGDSVLRKMYQALLTLLTNNTETGSISTNIPPSRFPCVLCSRRRMPS